MSERAAGTGMHNLAGAPLQVGAVKMRASTGHYFGGTTHTGLVQRQIGPQRWSAGRECPHRHLTATDALACAERWLAAEYGALGAPR